MMLRQEPPPLRATPAGALQRQNEATQELDALFRRAFNLRDAKHVCDLIDWMSRQKSYSLYNLWLAKVQRPGCGAIATERRWRERGRAIRSTAQPILILRPGGPVMVVYEVGDTDGPPLPPSSVEPRGHVNHADLDRLSRRAARGGHIEIREEPHFGVLLGGDVRLERGRFLIRIAANGTVAQRFSTLCHELAHIYCGHLGLPAEGGWWPDRRGAVGKGEREFEAEGAAHLVLSRAGVETRSAEYLAGYAARCDMAQVSMDTIIRAASRIEQHWMPAKGLTAHD